MNVYTLEKKQFFKKPLKDVFSFFQTPENLSTITPPDLGFQILTPSPIEMKQGALIDYVIHILGVPIRWRTLITTYHPPFRFVDEQLKGPYSLWHHVHEFREFNGGTEMTDRVTYALSFGFIGTLLHRLFIKKQLGHIFEFRAQVISKILS